MKKQFFLFILLISSLGTFAQNKNREIENIVREGEQLYRLEMASWNGNDIFLDNYANKNHVGGYLSYPSSNDSTVCIFYSKSESPLVLGSVTFDSSFKPEKAIMRTGNRDFNEQENELYTIRKNAVLALNSDTLFKSYNNTSLNLIPIVYGGKKKVYILTGPRSAGVVILGNDYLLEFDKYNDLLSKKQLHRNLIPIEYDANNPAIATLHTHTGETGDFITPTDICTLMLYAPFAGWKTHYVLSRDYVCIWDCVTNELTLTTRLAWDKMSPKKKGLMPQKKTK